MKEVFNGNKGKYKDFPGGSVVKNLPANAEDLSVPASGRPPSGGNGNPLQYSCLKNPMDERSLVGCSPLGCRKLDKTERASSAPQEPGFSALQADSLPSEPPGKPNNKSIINYITLGRTYKYINLCFRTVVVVICSMQHLTKLHI